jgi:hypothetical protein
LDKAGKKKPHFILSKVFSKSKRSRTRSPIAQRIHVVVRHAVLVAT